MIALFFGATLELRAVAAFAVTAACRPEEGGLAPVARPATADTLFTAALPRFTSAAASFGVRLAPAAAPFREPAEEAALDLDNGALPLGELACLGLESFLPPVALPPPLPAPLPAPFAADGLVGELEALTETGLAPAFTLPVFPPTSFLDAGDRVTAPLLGLATSFLLAGAALLAAWERVPVRATGADRCLLTEDMREDPPEAVRVVAFDCFPSFSD